MTVLPTLLLDMYLQAAWPTTKMEILQNSALNVQSDLIFTASLLLSVNYTYSLVQKGLKSSYEPLTVSSCFTESYNYSSNPSSLGYLIGVNHKLWHPKYFSKASCLKHVVPQQQGEKLKETSHQQQLSQPKDSPGLFFCLCVSLISCQSHTLRLSLPAAVTG